MKYFIHHICVFGSLLIYSNGLFSLELNKADEFLEAGFYTEAANMYTQWLEQFTPTMNDEQSCLKVRFHLGQAYFSMGKYDACIEALRPNITSHNTESFNDIRNDSLYLTALASKESGQFEKAANYFENYVNGTNPKSLSFFDEGRFELGWIHFHLNNHEKAGGYFKALSLNRSSSPRLRALAELYLIRILLLQDRQREALTLSTQLKEQLSDDPLEFELNYLQGQAHFQLRDYEQALQAFEKALPDTTKKCSWQHETLYYLGWSYLNIADADENIKFTSKQIHCFDKAEATFKHLIDSTKGLSSISSTDPTSLYERACLALGQCYLTRANRLNEKEAYLRAEELLRKDIFRSKEAQAQALLLRAQAAPTYEERNQLYQQLTEDRHERSAKGWYNRAFNDFEQGMSLKKAKDIPTSKKFFKLAASSFNEAFNLLKDKEHSLAGTSLKYQALSLSHINDSESNKQAFDILEALINNYSDQWKAMEEPDEVLYLHGFFASHIARNATRSPDIAERSFRAAIDYPDSKYGDIALQTLGSLYFDLGDYATAEKVFVQLINDFPSSPFCGEAWLWTALCADKMQLDHTIAKERRRQAFENYPDSPVAPEAYFTYYTYQDYLQGDRQAIKHLQNFSAKFPESLILIESHYLIGLDFKRDRKTAEGKWIRKKSLTEAIESFHQVETVFDSLMEKGLIPDDKLDYYVNVRYRATLERAMANLAIAEESQGAKREIYLEYAEGVFKRLVDEFKNPGNAFIQILMKTSPFPPIYQESYYLLAETFIKAQNDSRADGILDEIIERYKANNLQRNYYLARTFYEKGCIASRSKKYHDALNFFKEAEEAAKGIAISTDQKLDLWIQQSLCYSGLEQYDNAILILSKTINDDAISTLRLKAMYLRAETYEIQGRPELARKQFESLAKKGGTWALKAKNKLENEYGY